MFRNTLPVLLGLTVTGMSAAYLLYLFLRREEDLFDGHILSVRSGRSTEIEVRIPKACIGAVIGRGGSTIREIQEKTGTTINLKEVTEMETHHTVIIQGAPEDVESAENLIHTIIMNQPLIQTHEVFIPQYACVRVIGRSGENIRSISEASNAKIIVESSGASAEMRATCRLMIKGTSAQIELAKSMIDEAVQKTESKVHVQDSIERLLPDWSMSQMLMSAEAVEREQAKRNNTEVLQATGKDGFMEVYVSAVESPDRFWLQMLGPRATELDKLVEEMSEYYKQDSNRDCHAVGEVFEGQLLAAPFSFDEKWYRTKVVSIALDDYEVEESVLTLYFVDYGDTDKLKKKQVCSLRPDFLTLKFQAIECSLAKVKPIDGTWSEQATELLEDLCHVAQWKAVTARIVSYKEREDGTVPTIELYDTDCAQDIDIAAEIVKQGFALYEETKEGSSSGPPQKQRLVTESPSSHSRQSSARASPSMRHRNIVPAGLESSDDEDSYFY